MKIDSRKRLQGIAVQLEETDETRKDSEGTNWRKSIFTVELTRFSSRTPTEQLSEQLRGKHVKLVQWCSQDWHRKLGVLKTLDPDETEAVLKGEKTETVFW